MQSTTRCSISRCSQLLAVVFLGVVNTTLLAVVFLGAVNTTLLAVVFLDAVNTTLLAVVFLDAVNTTLLAVVFLGAVNTTLLAVVFLGAVNTTLLAVVFLGAVNTTLLAVVFLGAVNDNSSSAPTGLPLARFKCRCLRQWLWRTGVGWGVGGVMALGGTGPLVVSPGGDVDQSTTVDLCDPRGFS